MGQKQQYVTIKGTKDGFTLYLNDTCSIEEILKELEEKLSSNHHHQEDSPLVSVHIKIGKRYLTKDLENKLREVVRSKRKLVVHSIDSEVMTREEALEWKKNTGISTVSKMVRSGQVLDVPGDLLLIGDVNPGGTVMAGGNIYILGALRGIAHAGCFGNSEAVIAASVMRPSQLRIGEMFSRSPDYSGEDKNEMECAYIDPDKEQILIDRIQVLSNIRPDLTKLERGM